MKALTIIKNNKMVFMVGVFYLILLIVSPQKALEAFNSSLYYLMEMLQVLPIIFFLTVIIEAWIPKEMIMKGFGDKSGIKGNLLSLLLGSISAGPIYAAFPIGKSLLSKGASITNIVIVLSAWAVIKVPMLANEAKFLGVNFMIVRWILTVIAIFSMGYLMAVFIKRKDVLETDSNQQQNILIIQPEICNGCGLCAEVSPEYYEMKNGKAIVKSFIVNESAIKNLLDLVQKCPTRAIVFKKI